jgi:UDP-N-acetylglucosamine acyltransferase
MQSFFSKAKRLKIHKTAVISSRCQLGSNIEVGPYAVISDNTIIGSNTVIGAHVVIGQSTAIGESCQIYPYASVGSNPQDKKYCGEESYVTIGDHTQIREFVTINRATGEGEETRIGSDCLLLAYSHVAHNCVVGNEVVLSNAVMLAGHVQVEGGAIIGGLTGVHQFVKIGRKSMIGGASKVVQDVPPYITAAGNPAYAAGLNLIGMLRAGIDENSRQTIKKAYKILYLSGLGLEQAVIVMRQQLPKCDELEQFMNFLKQADRGICRVKAKAKRSC